MTDAPQTDAAPEPTTDPEAVAAELRQRLEAATRQAREEREARRIAEERATAAQQTAVQTNQVAMQAQADAIGNAVTAAETRMGALKRELTAAFSAGDYEKASDIQAEMAEVGATLSSVKQQKDQFEAKRQEALRAPPRQPPADPVEAFIATRTPRTASWLREHRDVAFRNGQLSRKLEAAHLLAEEEGHAPDSDGYFTFIEGHLGMTKAATPAPAETDQRAAARKVATAPAAPPSKDANYGGGAKAQTSYISPEVVRRAEWMGITPQELQAGIDEMERNNEWQQGNPYRRRA